MRNILFPFSISGRIGRAAFWKLIAVAAAPWIAIAIVNDLAILGGAGKLPALPRDWVLGLFAITGWIAAAAIIRRFHDRGRSLFWLILPLLYAGWFAWDYILASEAARGTTPLIFRRLSPTEIQAALDSAKWTAIAWLTGLACLSAPVLWMLLDLGIRRGEKGSNKYGPDPVERTFADSRDV
ncbi:MAG: DUF805 domain-containing protein [Hyphomicrobiaceae bacterium]